MDDDDVSSHEATQEQLRHILLTQTPKRIQDLQLQLNIPTSVAATVSFLEDLSQCAGHFRPDSHALLVSTVLALPWQDQEHESECLADVVLQFIQDVVSASPAFLCQSVAVLIKSFLQPKTVDQDTSQLSWTWTAPRVHRTLRGLLRTCPLATTPMFQALKENFPHKRRDADAHIVYFKQMLAVLQYVPALLPRIIQLVVIRLVDLDVDITVQQSQLEETAEEEDAAIFAVDLNNDVSERDLIKMRETANKLDVMMRLLLGYIQDTCHSCQEIANERALRIARGEKVARRFVRRSFSYSTTTEPSEMLLTALLSSFHSTLLPTHKCRCMQFLLFYACSFDTEFTEVFVSSLLQQVVSPHISAELRMASATYVASFLARANFVQLGLVVTALTKLIGWARGYARHAIAKARAAHHHVLLDVTLHGVFYAVVQSTLYLMCYKNLMLSEPDAREDRAKFAVRIRELLSCDLNPLKFCQENIVFEFEQTGLCDITEVMSQNEVVAVNSFSVDGSENILDDFFPFDPILLKGAADVIAPLYDEWQPTDRDRSEPRSSNLSGQGSFSLSEYTDASASMARSLQGMSVTPTRDELTDGLDSLMSERFADYGEMMDSFLSNDVPINSSW
eukprot:CAMPEP_0119312272 /NCGR_PEP_ID=MMETSP1333-20130426/25715_1 /TAXON_ID=418940 /ORGANISM="Scyphosphaera apsteinii, Strain RCC1455" /LENGTH=620 /DNA_ID=CAMNT_0007316869 /DNA_START=19 /DNA_END=1878 /DNA_ORIENTATION=+